MTDQRDQPDYQTTIRAWEGSTPWHRRASARLGLQGKLLLSFFALLCAALGVSCWMLVSESSRRLDDVMGEHARQLASALALASVDRVREHRLDELQGMGRDLIKSRNILFVGFLNTEGTPTVVASRDVEFGAAHLRFAQYNAHSLMQVHRRDSRLLGPYLQVIAPVLSTPPAPDRLASGAVPPQGARLLGYVAVGLSVAREEAQMTRIIVIVMGIGCAIALAALPICFVLVHRIFFPIRQLVEATQRISDGDLEAEVAVHRPDMIGHLARSFNEMVRRVRQQQEALALANARLAQANLDLEDKVEQRTAQLEMANQRLSAEIAEKEDFLRAVSHDLNAPLRNISGMATMLLMRHRGTLEADVVHRLERIQKNVELETGLIAELLELSRIKTRRQQMEPVEIDALVRDLGELFEDDLRSNRISLIIDAPLPVLNCERARLRQVFQNLIDNAIKYMGTSLQREIHIGCSVGVSEVDFYVRDTGMGIDGQDMDKIFYVFRRGRNSASQQIPGKGVGLASVKSIIETYNGKIWAESTPGQGSTFHFTINGRYVPASITAASAGRAPARVSGEAKQSTVSNDRNGSEV